VLYAAIPLTFIGVKVQPDPIFAPVVKTRKAIGVKDSEKDGESDTGETSSAVLIFKLLPLTNEFDEKGVKIV
jgi:hypothetical protein